MNFKLDLQGDPKGLSIGGLVVITKSMSLTVNCFISRYNILKDFCKALYVLHNVCFVKHCTFLSTLIEESGKDEPYACI